MSPFPSTGTVSAPSWDVDDEEILTAAVRGMSRHAELCRAAAPGRARIRQSLRAPVSALLCSALAALGCSYETLQKTYFSGACAVFG